jgi:hypothetical protein
LFGRNELCCLDLHVRTNSCLNLLFHASVNKLQSMAAYSWCVNYWRRMVIGMLIKTLWKFWLMDPVKHWDLILFAWQLHADTAVYFKLKVIDSCTNRIMLCIECMLILNSCTEIRFVNRNFNWAVPLDFKHIGFIMMSHGGAVGIATGYVLDDRGAGVRAPIGSRIFTSPYRPDRLRADQTS